MFLKKIKENNPKFKFSTEYIFNNLKIKSKPIIKFISLTSILLSINVTQIPNQSGIDWFSKDRYASEFHLKSEDEKVTDGLFQILDSDKVDTKSILKSLNLTNNK